MGGAFTRAGGERVGLIAAWDGSAWHPLGAGFDSLSSDSGTCQWAVYPAIHALAEYRGELIAGGSFRLTAAGDTVHCLARWDGSAWRPLGGGMGSIASDCAPPWVYALTVWNGDLIVGGSFRTAGGQPIARVARWDGTSWHAMGSGWTTTWGGSVWELAVTADGELIAAGWLQEPGVNFNKWQIASWNGTDWEQIGPDLTWISTPSVYTVFPLGPDHLLGGAFTGDVDGDTMNYVTILRCNSTTAVADGAPAPAVRLRAVGPNPFLGSTAIAFDLPRDAARLALEVHDLAGRRVCTLHQGPAAAGAHVVRWGGRRDDGRPAPPGVYFARLRAGDEARSLRLVRLE